MTGIPNFGNYEENSRFTEDTRKSEENKRKNVGNTVGGDSISLQR